MNLLIIGAGSFAIEIEEMARLQGFTDIAFLDDNPDKALARPVIGSMKEIQKYRSSFDNAIVAVGNNENRLKYHNLLEDAGFTIPILVHPMSYVSPDAKLSAGCIIRTFAGVGRYAEIGKAVILNIGDKVDHHCVIGEGCHLLINSVVRASKYVELLIWLDAGQVIQ